MNVLTTTKCRTN